jgi:hypothetical protein
LCVYAGIGTPEDTYGLVCEPTAGTDNDPHHIRPWAVEQRKKVTLSDPADLTNLEAPCYLYTAEERDTAASIADAFLLDLRLFVRDNVDIFQPVTVDASFGNDSWAQADFVTIFEAVGSMQLHGAIDPFFNCTDSSSNLVNICFKNNVTACLGQQNCTLSYSEQNVTISPAGRTLRVCNISSQFDKVAFFADPAVSQPRALRALLNTLNFPPSSFPVPANYCSSTEWEKQKYTGPQGPPDLSGRWVQSCSDGYVTSLNLAITPADPQRIAPSASVLLNWLLMLKRLQSLRMVVREGVLPIQLGALQELQWLQVRAAFAVPTAA